MLNLAVRKVTARLLKVKDVATAVFVCRSDFLAIKVRFIAVKLQQFVMPVTRHLSGAQRGVGGGVTGG
jgi:hypothetical protein